MSYFFNLLTLQILYLFKGNFAIIHGKMDGNALPLCRLEEFFTDKNV